MYMCKATYVSWRLDLRHDLLSGPLRVFSDMLRVVLLKWLCECSALTITNDSVINMCYVQLRRERPSTKRLISPVDFC